MAPRAMLSLRLLRAIRRRPRFRAAATTLLILNAGGVQACGDGGSGQLGNGQGANVTSPVSVVGLTTGVVSVDAGAYHSLAVMSDGTVRSWGDNYGGQLGNGTTANSNVPVTVSGLSTVVAVSGGYQHSLALKSDGTVMAWGRNGIGELGDGQRHSATRRSRSPA